MRLHCSWAVLVAIVWTIQLCNSATESIKNKSARRTLAIANRESEKSANTYHNASRRENGSHEISTDKKTASPLQTTDAPIIMENVAVDGEIVNSAEKKPLTEYPTDIVNILTSTSKKNSDASNDSLERKSNFKHYLNDEHGFLQPLSQNPCDLISLRETSAISRSTNEGANCSEAAQARKAQKTVDVKIDDHVASENRSPHDTSELGKLPTVVGKSETVMQQSEGYSRDIIASTAEYSSRELELIDLSLSGIDNSTRMASVNPHSKVSSSDKSSVVFVMENVGKGMTNAGKKIQDAVVDPALERSTPDPTITSMRNPKLLDTILDTDKLDERQTADTNNDDTVSSSKKQLQNRELNYRESSSSLMETTNFQTKKINQVTISTSEEKNRGVVLSSLLRRPTTDFHIGVVSGVIASGLSEKGPRKSLELSAADILHMDTSFSEDNMVEGLRQSSTRFFSEQNPYPTTFSEISKNHQWEVKDVHKKLRNLRGMNYPDHDKHGRELYLASVMTSGSGEINGEKARLTSANKAKKNKVTPSGRSGCRMDNIEKMELSDIEGKEVGFRRKVQRDNTLNRDSEKKRKIFRKVVKDPLTDSRIEREDHEILIGPTTEVINFEQEQLRQDTQDEKKTDEKLLAQMDTLEKDEFLELKNGATALENSSELSLAVEMQHENNVLNSISSVTAKQTRQMGLRSESDDSRTSWKMKTPRKHLIILRPPEMPPESLGSEKLLGIDGERAKNNGRGDSLIKTPVPVNFVEKVDDPGTNDSLVPTDLSFDKLYYRDWTADDDCGDKAYGCNDKNRTEEGFRTQQRSDVVSYRTMSTSNSPKKSVHTSNGWRTTFDADSIGDSADGQRKRKRWKDKIVDATIATDTLLEDRNEPITDVNHADSSDKKYVEDDRKDEAKEEFSRQANYIRKVKIDDTSGVSTVNRLKLRDSTAVSGDAPEIRRETRNDIAGEASDVEPCKACKIVAIVESTRTGPDKYSVNGDDRVVGGGDREQSPKKLERSIKVFEKTKDTNHVRIIKANEMTNVPVFSGNDVGSLARPKLKLIDRLDRESRVYRKMHQKESAMLVRGQEPIFTKAEAQNFIRSRKGVATHQPLSSGEFTVPDGAVTSGPTVRILNEKVKNSSSLDQLAGSQDSFSPIKSETDAKLEHGPLISGLTESFARGRISSHEFPNNAPSIPRDYRNFNTYLTSQTRSPSNGARRRKSVGHEQRTENRTNSVKIDNTTSFSSDRSHYNDRSTMNVAFRPHSHSTVSATRHQDGRLSNNGTVEQIKKGFTSGESTSIPVTAPALTSSYGHASSINAAIPEDRDIKSTETIIRTSNDVVTGFELSRPYPASSEIKKSLKSIETSPREIVDIPVIGLSNEDPVILVTRSPSPASLSSSSSSSFVRDKLLMSGESANFQRTQSKLTSESSIIGMGNTQSFNYTVNDNSTRTTATLNQWPVKYSAVVEGDLVLGGLMMVHEREDSVTCGPVMPQGGVQALEAMLFTLDWVNKRDLVPGVKIGAHILDDCDKDTYGLEMAVDFIKGSISNIDGAEYHCNKTAVRKVISGVVGAASSVTSIQVANLLRLFRIPQVSFFSTSPELSNKMRFEYFTRTIPSDHYQVKAMVDIVLVMGWSYVSIIYEESNYGEKAYEELEKLLGKHQICIAVKEKLSKDSGVAKAHVYDNIVLKLLTKPRARGCIIFASDQEVAGVMRLAVRRCNATGCIIFASDQEVAGVMKAVRRCNATGAFSWIGSDGWSARSLVSDGNEPEMEGTLSVQPQANPVEGFEDYFLNLTVENNRRNPWFVEFWEDHFKCRYPNSSQTPYNNYTEECTTTEKLTKQNTAFENQLQFVSDAVMAFAYAFRSMHIDLCHGIRGLCDAMKPTKGTELLSYLRTVQFKGLSGDVFHFDKNGDGPARYNIIHFKQVSPGKYKWIRVGKYLEGELRLNMSEIQFRLGHPQPPESVCSLPCEVGQAKKYVEGESCCWHCFNCTQYQIRHESDEKQCVLCPQGTVPDETHSYCRDIPENFLRPESGWAIGAMSFSSTGILITLFVGGVFLKHNDTPIVRASGRELSYVLLTGILLCYLVTFALVLRPNDLVCSIQRFSAGFCFTVVYAALLTKTNRISRIFNAGKHSAKRPSFISPRSQLIICSMLVAVQILINGVWMVIDPAKAMHHYPTREDNLLVCNSYIDASYMIAFTYPIILIIVCTVYAVLTRKIPEAFNESKHIGFTMYTTCVIWLAFVPLYFGTGSQVALRITSMSVTISLSASVTIACLFTPKLYIILIHPERNVRPNMMMTRYNTTKGSGVTATNASSMMAPVTLTAVTCDQNKAVKKHVITTMDCSTQSEQFEMEAKDQKNGKLTPAVVTRSTQTLLNNNGKESEAVTLPIIKDIIIEEHLSSAKSVNKTKIGNGPLSQNDVPL